METLMQRYTRPHTHTHKFIHAKASTQVYCSSFSMLDSLGYVCLSSVNGGQSAAGLPGEAVNQGFSHLGGPAHSC